MQIQNTNNQPFLVDKATNSSLSGSSDFASHLHKLSSVSQKIVTNSSHSVQHEQDITIKLGSLSGKNTTVAQLLLANPQLKANTWSIIHNPVNSNKAFHQIPLGKEIYYNQQTQEISWPEQKPISQTAGSITSLSNMPHSDAQKLVLGQINSINPTISNLLSQHSDLKAQRWDIIHDTINRNKAFTRIPSGSTVYFDANTRELSWDAPKNYVTTSSPGSDNNRILSKKLDDAVKPFMGTDYKHIDCYTLVVNGLKNMGVRYNGQDSLSKQLLHMAHVKGRANNAYFTGEGITEAMGKKVYTHSITQVNNIEQESKAIFKEMQSLMKKGDILSFSLETRGHTGIISQNNKQWTYINSGRLDHSISQNAPRHGVGEETLLNEINNWVKLAHKRNESLQITVGRLDTQKFA